MRIVSLLDVAQLKCVILDVPFTYAPTVGPSAPSNVRIHYHAYLPNTGEFIIVSVSPDVADFLYWSSLMIDYNDAKPLELRVMLLTEESKSCQQDSMIKPLDQLGLEIILGRKLR